MSSQLTRARRSSSVAGPAVEALESRQLLSSTLLVTVPGPIPSSVIAGAKVNDRIGVSLANQGPDRANGVYTLTLFASPDSNVSDGSEIATLTRHINITDGNNKTIFVKVPLFPQNLDGDYEILAQVSGPSTANVGVSSTPVAVSPSHVDLSNDVVSVSSKGRIGQKFTAVLDVTNLGNAIANNTLTTTFALSSSSTGANPFTVASLNTHIRIKPGASKVLHFRIPVAPGSPSGNQFVVATLDPANVFNDSSLGNNTAISLTPVSLT